MPGFISDHINLIVDNLRDRYKNGLPILKELIQNADDADATRLVFGIHDGFGDACKHVLLKGPALWVLNNGSFKEEDKRAIRAFGLNSKSGESGSIGKFGLGMKSVFHLCEAFFYVAYDGKTDHGVILNPWHDENDEPDSFHNQWETVGDDEFDCLRAVAKTAVTHTDATWLMLWIPLRRRSHVRAKNGQPYGAIVDQFPGDNPGKELAFLRDANLQRHIGTMLPLLKHLERIQLFSAKLASEFSLQLVLSKDTKRIDHYTPEMSSAGRIEDGRSKSEQLQFLVHQRTLIDQEPFHGFRALDAWPKSRRLKSDGTKEQVLDKSVAEGAVMFSHADGAVGKVQIRWAVFLPTEEDIHGYETRLVTSARHYQIVLHGQFFVDAGRRGIAAFRHLADAPILPNNDLDEADLHVGWNQAIAQQVVLPQFIPALARYATQHLDDVATEELTRAIVEAYGKTDRGAAGSGFYHTFRTFLTRDNAWVRVLTPHGREWTALPASSRKKLMRLPAPPKSDPQRPWKVMPRLHNIQDAVFCDASAPCIAPPFDDWEEAAIVALLDIDIDSGLCKETGIRYFVEFLSMEQQRGLQLESIQRVLVRLLQRGFRDRELRIFREVKSAFQSLVALVKPQYRVAIGTRAADALTALDATTLQVLMACETQLLLLPSDLDPDASRSAGQATDIDLASWITALDQVIHRTLTNDVTQATQKHIRQLLNAAEQVLDLCASPEAKARTLRLHPSASILTAADALTGREHPVSYQLLAVAHEQGLLYKQVFGPQKLGHAPLLAHALTQGNVYVISGDVARLIEDGRTRRVPSVDDKKSILEALGKPGKPRMLGDVEKRAKLLASVNETGDNHDARRGLRYLLHASPAHFMNDSATLWIEPEHSRSPWIKLWRAIEPNTWVVLESRLASFIPPVEWQKLNLSLVNGNEVIAKLQYAHDFSSISADRFTENERELILSAVADSDTWRKLPLHLDRNNHFGPIDTSSFREEAEKVPIAFASKCRIIKPAADAAHRQKQVDWIPAWTPELAIEMALEEDHPQRHWRLILDALHCRTYINPDLTSRIRSGRWLPLKNGTALSPEDIVDIEPLSDEIERLSSECDYCYAGVTAIAPEAREHPGYAMMRSYFASNDEALTRLGQMMSAARNYEVGEIGRLDAHTLSELLPVLREVKDLPAWHIVALSSEFNSIEAARNHLLPELSRPLPSKRLIAILETIPHIANNRAARKAFNLYLTQWAAQQDVEKSDLEGLHLLSRSGKWRHTRALCTGVTGIALEWQLDDEQSSILSRVISSNTARYERELLPAEGDSDPDDPSAESTGVLHDYFAPWSDLIQPGPVGAFLALLGKSPRGMASKWLHPHTYEWFADQIGWNDPGRRSDGSWDWMGGIPVRQALDRLQPRIRVTEDESITVVNLLGETVTVELDSSFETILVGAPSWKGGYAVDLCLRKLPRLGDKTSSDLSELLKRSCCYLLKEAYNQKQCNLNPLWDELEKSDQLSLAIARSMILDHLAYALKQLKAAKRSEALNAALNELRQHEREKSEAETSGKPTGAIEDALTQAKTRLGFLMSNDVSVQRVVLDALRERIRQNQYEISSIAFELFQNADDAVSELQMLQGCSGSPPLPQECVGRFVVASSSGKVQFIHWGRPINYAGHGDAINSAYQYDLEKMLILAGSDKDDGAHTTGKFGLGFKSVLLATDTPCVLSGDLKFRIVGGCLPEPWNDADSAVDLLERFRSEGGVWLRPTLVELAVTSEVTRQEVLGRFNALAGIQAIFGKSIRTLYVNEIRHDWHRTSLVPSCHGVEIGATLLPSETGTTRRLLLVVRGSTGAMAMRLNPSGATKFLSNVDHPVPSIWVTAPTREAPASSFILNADFKLDTGRGALPHGAGAEANLTVATAAASELYELVHDAVKASRADWEHAREQMQLSKDVTAAQFWATFWRNIYTAIATEEQSESARLLRQFGITLIGKYIRFSREIPNGMPAGLAAFTNVADILIAFPLKWHKVAPTLVKWGTFTKKFPCNGWIAADVANALQTCSMSFTSAIGQHEEEWKIPHLGFDLLLSVLEDKCCPLDSAAHLFAVLTDLGLDPAEDAVVSLALKELRFQAVDGSWQCGSDLIKMASDAEDVDELEALCSQFAPHAYKLNTNYVGASKRFVVEYGEQWIPSAERIVQWILDASTDESRTAALQYLLRGRYDVRFAVRAKKGTSWLSAIRVDSPYLITFEDDDKKAVVAILNPESFATVIPSAPVWMPSRSLTGPEALEAIWAWWEKDAVVHTAQFDKNFWPTNIHRSFDSLDEDRPSWMALFSLALMQRLGRTRDFQNRGFIDSLISKGWWDVIGKIPPEDDPAAWLGILKEYGESQPDHEIYSVWMDCFPRLYRIARWLDTYVHIFLSLDQRDLSQIGSLLSPRADHVLSGSGIDAPSIRSSLRLGQHIVIRELLRANQLRSDVAQQRAYLPVRRIKDLMASIGYAGIETSEDIFSTLWSTLGERATFNGAYDIPLLVLAEDHSLLSEILRLDADSELSVADNVDDRDDTEDFDEQTF